MLHCFISLPLVMLSLFYQEGAGEESHYYSHVVSLVGLKLKLTGFKVDYKRITKFLAWFRNENATWINLIVSQKSDDLCVLFHTIFFQVKANLVHGL